MIEVSTSLQAYRVLRSNINPYSEEVWILALDSQMRLRRSEMIFRGTAETCLLHPRDLFRCLIMANASTYILAHNHPSGSVAPSLEDIEVTKKIHHLSLLMEIPLNDHIIFSSDQYYSMADHGLLKFSNSKRKSKVWIY